MKIINVTISALICLGATAYAQERPPKLLLRAAHCLEAKDFLPISRTTTLSFGYLLDETSYPGEKVLYIVNYAAPEQSNGFVFAVFLTEQNGGQDLNIQNNARFGLSKDEFAGILFEDPPLGGTWTQEHLARAINQIERRVRFAIPTKSLLAVYPHLHCEAYTDR